MRLGVPRQYDPSAQPLNNHCYFCSARWLTRSSGEGTTQEALKPPGACYLLPRVSEGAGIESQVSQASLGALCTPRPRGELQRLLTTQKGSADRPQIGMGQAKMCPPQPLHGLSKGRAQLCASCCEGTHKDQEAFTHRTRPWEGISWPRSQGDIPSTGQLPGLRRGRFAQRGP